MESSGLKSFIPCRNAKRKNNEFPIEYVGLFSFLTYSWMDGFMWKAFRRRLKDEDFWTCPPVDSAEHNVHIVERMWEEEQQAHPDGGASLFRVCLRFCRLRHVTALFLMASGYSMYIIVLTVIFMKLLMWLDEPDAGSGYGILLVIMLFLVQFFFFMLFVSSFSLSTVAGVRLRAAILFMVYKKILNLKNTVKNTTGHYVNIFANDSTRIVEGTAFFHMLLTSPLLVLGATVYAIAILKYWALIGFAIMLLIFPLQGMIAKGIMHFRRKAIPMTDKRVKMMKETLENAKSVKMFAWEKPFSTVISGIRDSERKNIEGGNIMISLGMMISTIIIAIATMSTIMICSFYGKSLTYVEVFTYILLYANITGILDFAMLGVKYVTEFKVAIHRCQEILQDEEHILTTQSNYDDVVPAKGEVVLDFNDATFIWPDGELNSINETPEKEVTALKHITVKIKQGDIVGVAGPVGSGKSALISAVLGQLKELSGSFSKCVSVAFVPQQPWIFNASLRDNITFHQEFHKERYLRIIEACCLVHDINILPDGDLTEIGERGVNLSGGQKHRVNIARALYSDRDIVLMDDPFSALDPDISETIFHEAIQILLKDKTVVLVTHLIKFLPHCDYIIHMEGGQVRQQGTHSELLITDDHYADYINTMSIYDKERAIANRKPKKSQEKSDSSGKKPKEHSAKALMVKEVSEIGAVTAKTYWSYIESAGGTWALLAALAVSLLAEGCRAFSFWWLGVWLSAGSGNMMITVGNATLISPYLSDNPQIGFYILIYGMSLVGILIFFIFRSIVIMKLMGRASTGLHKKLFVKVLGSPMSFFDTMPIGQIINRFSKDQDEVDSCMPPEIDNIIKLITRILMFLILIGALLYWFFIPIPILLVLFILVYLVFRVGMRETRRVHNVSWSPLLGLVNSTIQGLSLVRTYNKADEFRQKFTDAFDFNTVTLMSNLVIKWWNAVRLQIITNLNVSLIALIIVLLKDVIPKEFAGVAIIYASQLTSLVQQLVQVAVDNESRFTSVERIQVYIKSLIQEKTAASNHVGYSHWPQTGRLEFQGYCMRYRDGLPLALKDLTFTVDEYAKIGIVGRTGAGKSSLTNALFRLCEAAGGKILIDGVDISTLSLEQLRSNISIIPQEPVLFSGTIRTNLDPFDQYDDTILWDCLEKCHLKAKIVSLEGGLVASVSEGGTNLSAGERQLLCLARVLLKKTKLLILDEATASVDTETFRLLQSCLQTVFASCTTLIIAHRLDTVITCDKILVVHDGTIVEFETPANLIADRDSHFYKLMLGSGNAETKSDIPENN